MRHVFFDTVDSGVLDMVFAGFLILLLIAVIVYQTISFNAEKRRLTRHNDDLLNRLMSRDMAEYAAGSRALPSNYKDIREYAKKASKEEEEAPADDGLGMPVT